MAEASDRSELLAAFADLRVADVRDGLDVLGLHHYGSMDAIIRPLFPARAFGIARTARYLPFVGEVPPHGSDAYAVWSGRYYGKVCRYPWIQEIEPGDFVVIDQSQVDAGLMGSENTLACLRRGVSGFVTNGGPRDTDEIILQQIPFWSAFRAKSMVQGRLQFDATQVNVAVGGVCVQPGDVVVADGDGVIVVPQTIALEVAHHAQAELRRDKVNRRGHYDALGKPLDDTVQ